MDSCPFHTIASFTFLFKSLKQNTVLKLSSQRRFFFSPSISIHQLGKSPESWITIFSGPLKLLAYIGLVPCLFERDQKLNKNIENIIFLIQIEKISWYLDINQWYKSPNPWLQRSISFHSLNNSSQLPCWFLRAN